LAKSIRRTELLPNVHNNWFKLEIKARRPKDDEPEVEYSYQSGHNKFFVLQDAKEALGPGYIIGIKEISYRQLLKEISNEESLH